MVIGSISENGFKATLSWQTNVLNRWMTFFSFFQVFKMTFSKSSVNPNLVKGRFLEKRFKAILGQKRMFWNLVLLRFFVTFWVTKLKSFSLKVRQSVHNYLNPKLVIEKWFWSYLEVKSERSEGFRNSFFNFFANFRVRKLKLSSENVRAKC